MIKQEAQLEGAGVEETHNSQILFFIQKELQLNTKFHYIEVTAASENYKITLCISKITVKRKIVLHISLHPVKTKNPKKTILKKGKGKEKKRECEREGKEKGKGKGKGERERREERKGKNGESGTKNFFKYTASFGYVP